MIWWVALGSAVGGVARFLLGDVIQRWSGSSFPLGTLVINVTGSILLGVIMRYALQTPAVTPEARAFLAIGLCGGYTTFSTFSYETAKLLEDGDWLRAALYVSTSVVLAVTGMFLGFALARR